MNHRKDGTSASEAVIGQIGKAVGMFLLTSEYSETEIEEITKRVMLNEKIPVHIASTKVFLVRDPEFDTWYLTRE